MPTKKYTFTFVVEGVELSDEQQQSISQAVGQAGTTTLSDVSDPETDFVIGPYLKGYRGLPAFDLEALADVTLADLQERSNELVARISTVIQDSGD
jgi:hypothetical protein